MNATAGERSWVGLYLATYITYVVLGLAWRFLLSPVHGDAITYVYAARHILDGSFDIYTFLAVPESAPPLGSTYAYSPLLAYVLAPFVGLAQLLGWDEENIQRVTGVPLLLFDVLAMHQLRKLVRAWRPYVDERFVYIGVFLTLFLTGLWVVSAARGHHEGMVLFFLFLALRVTLRDSLLGGIYTGLALAAKQVTILALLPLGLVMLLRGNSINPARGTAGAPMANRLRQFAHWAGPALLVPAVIILPALLSNPDATLYALVTQHSRLTFYGTGLPVRLDEWARAVLDAQAYAQIRDGLIAHSNTILLAVVATGCVVALLVAERRRKPVVLSDARLMALVAFGGVSQIVLGKWTGSHYYSVPLALVLVWDLARTAPASPREGWGRLSLVPWIGLGAAIAFRSVTQINPVALKDWLILALFSSLWVVTLAAAVTQSQHDHDRAAESTEAPTGPEVRDTHPRLA